jgi:NTE family protein
VTKPEELPRALCLSGGGYRAMLFHLGALWRLNEARLLPTLDLVSSVSGGSITAGVLANRWQELRFDPRGFARRFDMVVDDLHAVASKTIDARAIVTGALGPGSIGDKVARAYGRRLFGVRTLRDLPDRPRFVFCATSLQTGSLWRFSKPYMADYRVGLVPRPQVPLAIAVAASSAFPPFLSPVQIALDPSAFQAERRGPLHREPYVSKAVLSDGGVYDNLGLEPAWGRSTTIFVSDGGGQMAPQKRPWRFWPVHTLRVLSVIDNQVRALRKRALIEAYKAPTPPDGTYWGIRTDIANYELDDAMHCPIERTTELAQIRTRLGRMHRERQRRLVNWGYAVCDAALRRWVTPAPDKPSGFPYPDEGV